MKGYRRYNFIWKLLYYPALLFAFLRFNYHPKRQRIGSPCLVVSNHCTDLDPVLLSLTVRDTCYYIASDHIFRGGLGGRILTWIANPITRLKGVTAGDTALAAIRRMRKGYNVAVFAEGNRSFNGQTADIIESTAKLAKASGASLVTHRFKGGYLSSPRWSGNSARRGKLTGEIVNIYPPEQLKAMKPAEIADIIRADIYENAYETQRQWMIPYRGKKLAEHLERALCICPACKQLGQLTSRDDEFFCSCGMRTRYNKFGFFEGGGLPFDNVLDWDKWQAQELLTRTQNAGQDCIASDDGVALYELDENHTKQSRGVGTLRIFADRMELGGEVFAFDSITGIGISGSQSLDLSCGDHHFVVSSDRVCNLRKYLSIYRAATEPDKILSI